MTRATWDVARGFFARVIRPGALARGLSSTWREGINDA